MTTADARRSTTRQREPVSAAERAAAARARVTADRRRGVETPEWIVQLAVPRS